MGRIGVWPHHSSYCLIARTYNAGKLREVLREAGGSLTLHCCTILRNSERALAFGTPSIKSVLFLNKLPSYNREQNETKKLRRGGEANKDHRMGRKLFLVVSPWSFCFIFFTFSVGTCVHRKHLVEECPLSCLPANKCACSCTWGWDSR